MAELVLAGLEKRFLPGGMAVAGVDLKVRDGELLVLAGPSGGGKTTLLRLIAGLERASRGEVWIGGQPVTQRTPAERRVAFLFQEDALLPHLTVIQNIQQASAGQIHQTAIARGAQAKKHPSQPDVPTEIDQPRTAGSRALADAKARTAAAVSGAVSLGELLSQLGIESLATRYPTELSGGQRRRAGLARTLLRTDRDVVLLDEPLSAIDASHRDELRETIRQVQRRTGVTMIYVTHDQSEALALADRLAILIDGELAQVGAPREVYYQPADRRVARFLGRPPINLLAVELVESGVAAGASVAGRAESNSNMSPPGTMLRCEGLELKVEHAPSLRGPAIWGMRPELIRVCGNRGRAGSTTHGDEAPACVWLHVRDVEWYGGGVLVGGSLHAGSLEGAERRDGRPNAGGLPIAGPRWRVSVPGDSSVQVGSWLRLEIDWQRSCWFDAETGLALDRGESRG